MGIREFVKKPHVRSLYQKVKRLFCRVVGERGFWATHAFLERLASIRLSSPPVSVTGMGNGFSGKPFRFGLNIAGDITAEGGVAEGVRTSILASKAAGIPYVLNSFNISHSPNSDSTYASELVKGNPYGVNLVQVNANKVPSLYNYIGTSHFRNKYNIGFWAWELSAFPQKWHDRFSYFQEIWTPSLFCREALTTVSPIRVMKVMHAVEIKMSRKFERQQFGIPEGRFVFFFMFDFYSTFERKNPMAVVEAFKAAFAPNEPVTLVLKFYNSEINHKDCNRLYKAAPGHSILLINDYLSRDKIYGLLACCDAYVSLHRSEGFGLTMAEAMYLGKPVIATNYSGNTEFMKRDNSFLVEYRLKELERDFGPYRKGNVWADPDVEDAARWMRYVYENMEAARKIGARAAEDIRQQLSPKKVGALIKTRISEIVEMSN